MNIRVYVDGEYSDTAYNVESAISILHGYAGETKRVTFEPDLERLQYERDLLVDCYGEDNEDNM